MACIVVAYEVVQAHIVVRDVPVKKQKILKPAPLDGKKFVDIKVFLQLTRTSMKTCFKLVFAETRSKRVFL